MVSAAAAAASAAIGVGCRLRRAIAEVIKESTVCSLARANEKDVRRAGEAIKPAARGRIHTFIATSPIHMEKKLRMKPDEVVEAAVKAVKWALEYTDDVEFSAEDAVRSEMDFLVRIFDAVIQAGASVWRLRAARLGPTKVRASRQGTMTAIGQAVMAPRSCARPSAAW